MKIEYGIQDHKPSVVLSVAIDNNRLATITCESVDGALPAAPRVIGGGRNRAIQHGDRIEIRAEQNETEIACAARALRTHRSNLRAA